MIIDKSLRKLSVRINNIPKVQLPGVMSKKIKEFDKKLKARKLDQYDSSDLQFEVKKRNASDGLKNSNK